MTEAGPSLSNQNNPDVSSASTLSPPASTPPIMPDATLRASRPLSEISENENRRRSSARQSIHSVKGDNKPSRPNSEVRDEANAKRLSGHIATITLNLNNYASVAKRPPSALSTKSRDSLISPSLAAGPSINKIPAKPERPASFRTTSVSSIKEIQREQESRSEHVQEPEPDTKEGHPLLVAKRASLRPSPLGASYADVAKSEPPTPSTQSIPDPLLAASTVSLSTASPRSSIDSTPKPLPKSKPSWLRRASGTAAFRSKSKSPVLKEETLPASASLPPELPPRRGAPTSTGLSSHAERPPNHPSKSSYASIAAAAGPSRSRLGEGAGRPAISPPLSTQPTRDNLNIRSRIAAWTTASQQPSISRSESSSTIATTASSAFTSAQQRIPASASRMIGSAGSAVQKGWAGLRARGMGGSISGLSSIAASGEARRESLEPPKFSRKPSRDRSVSAQATMGSTADGPVLHHASVLRRAGDTVGKVFGRDISEAGKAWGVVDADKDIEGMTPLERRRRECLPAVIIRAVDYLEVWGPKEEGIFRISGRSSHINRLRKEFDAGADIDMADCHPGDLDPHAVSGIFKLYLRELPSPPLTKELTPRFEAAARRPKAAVVDVDDETEDVSALLLRLPAANWFLLAEIVKLLVLIPSHSKTNRMTLNALMLSLGPSLNIPGGVLTELLDRREELFSSPPPISGIETANDLIDFGDNPVTIASIDDISRSTTPVSRHTLETPLSAPLVDKLKKYPLLPSKPSISRLFGAAPSLPRKDTGGSTTSVVQPSPPRVELRTDSPRLPSFEAEDERKVEEIREKDLPEEPTEPLADAQYPAGTVQERTRAFSTSTPIAEMYSRSSGVLPSLRQNKSNGSFHSAASASAIDLDTALPTSTTEISSQSAPANPASVIRRGPPIFFQSASVERRGRIPSGNSIPLGVKRKDDSPSADSDGAVDEGRAKRLSAGPGTLGGSEAERGTDIAS